MSLPPELHNGRLYNRRPIVRALILVAVGTTVIYSFCCILTRPLSSKQVHSRFSSLVVFGDSYSDNGHNASDPFRNPIYAGLGNASTGILWPNLLRKKLSADTEVQLYDYAYNGAHANEKLTDLGQHIPDTRTQKSYYISDLASGKVSHKGQEVLYVLWVGINPLDAIWIDACDPDRNNGTGAQYPSDPPFLNATTRVQRQIEEVYYQIADLRNATAANDFLIVGVPNITIAPLQRGFARDWAKCDTKKGENVLKLLGLLIEQYNSGLISKFSQIQSNNDAIGGFMKVYDVSKIWNSVIQSPQKYGIENVSDVCYNNNTPCSDIDKYFFWDYLHPTPTVEKIIAQDMFEFIENQPSQNHDEHYIIMSDQLLKSATTNQIILT
ncbi:family 16 carbohydrate esterase [Melampsora larici-populina 98AG31]|uniref:Family 16 carbohydrate esterase n=1 Tax=Melampsora larici-populina (strain 98AG31 / pathotype 3-4-7) TaxID=747676 RepID=F4RG46_MELLP|nr:family 16 carbohydrate esterase [Melampsora larici-populina 98AG31]EGG08545.1 family 16 carbohydrate esterase [Melampsora larici-populina 98AG31]